MFIWGRLALQHTITLWFSWIHSGTGKTGSTCDWVCLPIYRILSTLHSLSSHSPHTHSTITLKLNSPNPGRKSLTVSLSLFLNFLICKEVHSQVFLDILAGLVGPASHPGQEIPWDQQHPCGPRGPCPLSFLQYPSGPHHLAHLSK